MAQKIQSINLPIIATDAFKCLHFKSQFLYEEMDQKEAGERGASIN